LHHTSPKFSIEYGPDQFLAKKQAHKNLPLFLGQKMAKIGQNRPKAPCKDVNDIKNFCFLHHTSPKYSLEYGPNRYLAKKSDQKNQPTLQAQK
jgi:hypothetical protein